VLLAIVGQKKKPQETEALKVKKIFNYLLLLLAP
jgi:hypothetical protein